VLLVIIALPLLFPLLIGGVIASWANQSKFKQQYKAFLDAYNNMIFFCYSDRRNKHDWVEDNILPHLDPAIGIIFVKGREPFSDFNKRCVSYMLDNIKSSGCPAMMRITDGSVYDTSLEYAIQDVFDGNSDIDAFLNTVIDTTGKLQQMGAT
jgi:hypothetical protein